MSSFKKRSPFAKKLGELVEPVTREALKKRGFEQARLFNEWAQIVGSGYASRCIPEKITFAKNGVEGGVLHIRASGQWALELQHKEPVIVQRITTFFGYKAISRVAIKQGVLPPVAATPAPAPTLTAQEAQHVRDQVGAIEDEEIKASLIRLGEHITANNKRLNKTT